MNCRTMNHRAGLHCADQAHSTEIIKKRAKPLIFLLAQSLSSAQQANFWTQEEFRVTASGTVPEH